MRSTSVVAGTNILLATAFAVTSIGLFFDPPQEAVTAGVVMIAISGVFAPGLAQFASTAGVDRLGPSTSIPIQTGARPLLSALGGVVLLGESMDTIELIGIALIVLGGWWLSRADASGNSVAIKPGEQCRQRAMKPRVLFPLGAAMSFSISDVLVKEGMSALQDPTLGPVIGTGSAFLVWALTSAAVPSLRKRFLVGQDAGWFVAAGILVALGILAIYRALMQGEVSTIIAIASSQPLPVLLFSTLFLRHVETIRLKTAIAAVGVVIGTSLLTV